MNKTPFLIVMFALVIAPTYVDYGMTNHALASGRYYEANPVARLYVSQPALVVPIITIGQYGSMWALNGLFDDTPALAWILVAALAIAKGFVLYHNLKVLR